MQKDLWSWERKSVARAWLLGVLVAAAPVPGIQLVLGVPLALCFRANLYVMTSFMLLPNPVTAAIYYPLAYLFGCLLLGMPPGHFSNALPLLDAGGPIVIGSTVLGLSVGVTGFLLLRCLPGPAALAPVPTENTRVP